jgi:hypothetical protein
MQNLARDRRRRQRLPRWCRAPICPGGLRSGQVFCQFCVSCGDPPPVGRGRGSFTITGNLSSYATRSGLTAVSRAGNPAEPAVMWGGPVSGDSATTQAPPALHAGEREIGPRFHAAGESHAREFRAQFVPPLDCPALYFCRALSAAASVAGPSLAFRKLLPVCSISGN